MKLATYNIHYGVGLDGSFDLRRVLDAVSGADVIALQEVDVGWDRSDNTHQPQLIAELLSSFEYAWGPTVDVRKTSSKGAPSHARRQFGNMVLSRYPIISTRNYLFRKYGSIEYLEMQRGALETVVDTPLGMLRLYSVHLCNLSETQRIFQLKTLLDLHRNAADEGPVISGRHVDASWSSEGQLPPMPRNAIILGDMNFSPNSPAYEEITGELSDKYGHLARHNGFVDAWAFSNLDGAGADNGAGATTQSYSEGGRRIDYCFVSSELAPLILRADVDNSAKGSDHYPLVVTMNSGASCEWSEQFAKSEGSL